MGWGYRSVTRVHTASPESGMSPGMHAMAVEEPK